MLEARQFDDLSEFLQSCVNSIKADFPRFSSSQIAKRLGIPNSTFDRISKREVKSPSFTHAMKIVKSAITDDNVQDFVAKFYPDFSEDFQKAYAATKDSTFVSASQENCYLDAATYEILMMATSHSGVTRGEIKELYGMQGLKALDQIVETDSVEFDDGVYRVKETAQLPLNVMKTLVSNLIQKNYDQSKFGTQSNYLAIMWERVNKEKVQPLLHQLNVDYHTKVWNLLSAKENQGEDLMWAVLSTDSFANNQQVLQ